MEERERIWPGRAEDWEEMERKRPEERKGGDRGAPRKAQTPQNAKNVDEEALKLQPRHASSLAPRFTLQRRNSARVMESLVEVADTSYTLRKILSKN